MSQPHGQKSRMHKDSILYNLIYGSELLYPLLKGQHLYKLWIDAQISKVKVTAPKSDVKDVLKSHISQPYAAGTVFIFKRLALT